MVRKLYYPDPHQLEAYEHLVSNPRAVLLLGMSLSKTVVSLSYLFKMHYEEAAFAKTLVIAPDKVARVTWPDEINTWEHLEGMRYSLIDGDAKQRTNALNADAEIFLIGVQNVCWLIDQYMYKDAHGKWHGALPYDCILIDELTLFKSPKSQRFKALRRAIRPVEYRIGMTGTFTPNGYIDAWAQIVLIDGGVRLGYTFGDYVSEYFTTRGNGMITYEYVPKRGALNTIADKIADIALTMFTRDHVAMPPLFIVDHEIEFSPQDKAAYDELEREYVLEYMERYAIAYDENDEAVERLVTVKTAADLTNKLLQVSSGAVYEDKEPGVTGPRVWWDVNTRKIEMLAEIIAAFPNESIMIPYAFKHEVARIKEAFPYAREFRKGKYINEDVAEWNAGLIPLLLIHPLSAGHGLNLQFGGRRMVWFTPTWNLEHWEQVIARLLRRGAKEDVYVHRILIKGTRDMKVRTRITSKDSDQTFLLKEIKELRKKYGNLRK